MEIQLTRLLENVFSLIKNLEMKKDKKKESEDVLYIVGGGFEDRRTGDDRGDRETRWVMVNRLIELEGAEREDIA